MYSLGILGIVPNGLHVVEQIDHVNTVVFPIDAYMGIPYLCVTIMLYVLIRVWYIDRLPVYLTWCGSIEQVVNMH